MQPQFKLFARIVSALAWATASAAFAQDCPCDCNQDEAVRVAELVTSVRIATGSTSLDACPSADRNGNDTVAVNELIGCVRAALEGCEAIKGGPPPGIRRFSLDTRRSELISTLPAAGDFPTPGFTGYLDLRARRVFQSNTFFLDVVGSSEYLSVDIPTVGSALCVRPIREEFPVLNAGVLYCAPGNRVGLALNQDRIAGVIAACQDDGLACTADSDCATGICFGSADCNELGGTIEPSIGAGVCIGPIVGTLRDETSEAGSALISPDPVAGRIVGLPVQIVTETSLPCGDEPDAPGMTTPITLTTGVASARLDDVNRGAGEVLETQSAGVPFDCDRWTGENSPGTLVFSAPTLDVDTGVGTTDLISTWRWVD